MILRKTRRGWMTMMRAADQGGAAGSSSETEKPEKTEGEPEAQPEDAEKEPEPEGKTMEQKLASVKGHLSTFFKRAKSLAASLKQANADKTRVEGQFNALEESSGKLKTENTRLTSELADMTSKHETEQKRANSLDANCTRLEKLCGLNGIDHTKAVAAPTGAPGSNGSAAKPQVVAEYEKLVKDEADEKVTKGTAFKFYQKNKKELGAYLDSRS